MTPSKTIDILAQTGCGFWLSKGQMFRIIDPLGQQVADVWAISTQGCEQDWLSTSQTRDITERLFPTVGDCFYSEKAAPILRFVESNSPCAHDMLFPACNPALYERAGLPNHPNCKDNFLKALKDADIVLPIVPDPVNFFQCSMPQPDGTLEVLASNNPPGGNVLLRAEMDIYVVVTACSVDFHPTNGGNCTDLQIIIY